MVGWHHRLYGREFEQTLGVDDGQGGLACCSPWGHKKSDMPERLNNSNTGYQCPKAACDPTQTEPVHRCCRRSVSPQINLEHSPPCRSLCWAHSSLKERNEEKKEEKKGSSVRAVCADVNESSVFFPQSSQLALQGRWLVC